MTSRRAADTERRLDEIARKLDVLERRFDEIEDLIEAAWDEAVARLPRRAQDTASEQKPDASQGPPP